MAVFTRGKKYWICYTHNKRQIKEPTGIINNGTDKNRKLAEAMYFKRDIEIREGKFFEKKKNSDLSLEEFSRIYTQRHVIPSHSQGSWKITKNKFDVLLRSSLGKFTLEQITQPDIENFIAERLEAGNKQSTANRYIQLLKTMYHRANDWGITSHNPTIKIKKFSEKKFIRERILTESELARLIENTAHNQDLMDATLILLNTGLRKSELLYRKWAEIDFDNGVIRVDKRKNDKPLYAPMNQVVKDILLKRRLRKGGDIYVFQSRRSKTPKPYHYRGAFEAARKRANLLDLRIHDLRHCFASYLAMQGTDIGMIKELLGHEEISMSLRYTKYFPMKKLEAVRLLEKISIPILAQPSKSQKEQEINNLISQLNETT